MPSDFDIMFMKFLIVTDFSFVLALQIRNIYLSMLPKIHLHEDKTIFFYLECTRNYWWISVNPNKS